MVLAVVLYVPDVDIVCAIAGRGMLLSVKLFPLLSTSVYVATSKVKLDVYAREVLLPVGSPHVNPVLLYVLNPLAEALTISTSGTYRTTAKTTTAVYEFQKGTSSGFESANLSNNPASFTFSQDFTETSSFRHTIYIPSVYITAGKEYKIQKLNTVSNNYEDLADTQFDTATVSINVGNLTGVSYQKRSYNGILATAGDYKLVRTQN